MVEPDTVLVTTVWQVEEDSETGALELGADVTGTEELPKPEALELG